MTTTPHAGSGIAGTPSSEALDRLLSTELSLPSRLRYVALLLAASMMTTVVGALWVTEAGLPPRTQLAFAVMLAIGLSWAGFALWVLNHRRPLLARHKVVAGRMAVLFTSVFVVGALAVGYTAGGAAPLAAAGVGIAMLAAAIVLLVRAHRTFARLTARRRTLERELGRGAK